MFLHPWWFTLLPIVPWLAWRMWSGRDRSALGFSSVVTSWNQRPSLRQRLAWLPAVLMLVSLTLMIISLARPRYGKDQTIVTSEGIAIELVVDRSGSMKALDFQIDGRNVDRLTAIKNVASKFILGDESSPMVGDDEEWVSGRVSDMIGLVTFAGYVDAITPPTLDHGFLVASLENTEIVTERDEDGTAIGDAISLAVDKLSSLGRQDRKQDDDATANESSTGQGKVIILLTDGENTAGQIDPAEAAELAKAMNIKVYTIGVGTKGQAPYPVRRRRSGQIVVDYFRVNIDEETLKMIADTTGGRYFRATDTASLETIYDEIDQLEKTKVETQRYTDFREMAVQSVRIGGWWIPPILGVALACLTTGVLLSLTVFRRFN
ncbi:von Willebrand factor type A domain protein [Rubripirellula lacrimiformis]|uniref:von Willebrand factor type A domain protein n=1 Tax=Rubripirellula lacrimiformis TaxID=1930273 RepID=A0A517NB30_9BACT|nr:VWA domain-containing protein [Rubripirellula lacrimiformis]QDT04337.1 von Willebrand factor type A domain protein [Rubripirellula lacrimiformis]